MSAIVDYPEITNAYVHRQDLRRVAIWTAHRPSPAEPAPITVGPPVLAARRQLVASLTGTGGATATGDAQKIDPSTSHPLVDPRGRG